MNIYMYIQFKNTSYDLFMKPKRDYKKDIRNKMKRWYNIYN